MPLRASDAEKTAAFGAATLSESPTASPFLRFDLLPPSRAAGLDGAVILGSLLMQRLPVPLLCSTSPVAGRNGPLRVR